MKESMPQERDAIAGRSVGVVAIVALVLAVLGVVVSTALLGARPKESNRGFPAPRTSVIGMVEQSPIATAHRAEDSKREEHAALEHYRYLDDKHETAEIPVDRAMDILVRARSSEHDETRGPPPGDRESAPDRRGAR